MSAVLNKAFPLCRLRTHELKNVRRLAHEVLLQRSDVEIFLVSSLKQVGRHSPSKHAAACAEFAVVTT